jgi:hypothetical protein
VVDTATKRSTAENAELAKKMNNIKHLKLSVLCDLCGKYYYLRENKP